MTTRATLPQEFYDINSDRLLLTPEPKYLHARLWKNALKTTLTPDALLGIQIAGRQFGNNGAEYQTDVEAGRLTLSEDLMTSLIELVPEFGAGKGHTVRLNRPTFTDTVYTEATREIPAGTTISTTPVEISSDQVPVTLKRYGGPVADSSATGGVRPYSVDRFDGSVMQHRPAQIVGLNLKRDFDRTIDGFMVKLFDQAPSGNIIRPTGFSTDDSSTIAGDAPMSYAVLSDLEKAMDEGSIGTLPDGKRVYVATPRQKKQLSQDPQFSRLSENHPLFNALYAGTYWRTVGNFHVFSSNTLTRTTNSNSVPIHYGQAMGPGAVGCGIGGANGAGSLGPRVANHTNDNFGETALVIWLMYAAFAMLDSRFVFSVRTS